MRSGKTNPLLRPHPTMRFTAFLYRIFIHNYKIKLFCLISALFFWYYITIESQFEYIYEVPFHLVNPPTGRILLHPVPSRVKVRFKGTGRAFINLRFIQDRKMILDLRRANLNGTIPLTIDMIRDVPSGLNVKPLSVVEPETIHLEWDRMAEKRVPVLSQIRLVPADGYVQVGDIAFEPDSVRIRGPQSEVDSIQEVYSEKRTYEGLIKGIKDKIALQMNASNVLQYSVRMVRFNAQIQRLGEKVLQNIPVQAVHVPGNLRVAIVPPTLMLKIQGGVDLLAHLKKEDVTATIDYRNRNRHNAGRYPAMIQIPKDITFSEVEPKVFELWVVK